MKALYPGTFDPVTYGHIDLANRALSIFDELIIAVAESSAKKPLFSVSERICLLETFFAEQEKVSIISFDSLLIDLADQYDAKVVVRGLRAVSDFEFELQMALMNKKMAPKIETIFMMPDEKYTYLSSTQIKEIARLGGDISKFVPPMVTKALAIKKTPD